VAVFDKDGERTKEDALKDYADDKDSNEPVYGYVPYGTIIDLLKKDGYTDENIYGIFRRL
jgi:hypothetical protein